MNDHASVQWIERLHDPDSDRRIVALTELIDDPDTVTSESIIPLLEDAEVTVRELAVQLLEEIGDPKVIPALLNRIADDQESIAKTAESALREFRTPTAISFLVSGARHLSPKARAAALSSLRDFKDQSAAQTFIAAVEDASPKVRREGILGLAYLKQAESRDLIRRAMSDPDWEIRRVAVEAIAGYDETVVQDLLITLKDLEWQVRAQSASSLGHFRGPEVAQALSQALFDSHWQVVKEAIYGLAASGTELPSPLWPFLEHDSSDIRIAAAVAVGRLGGTAEIIRLEPLLNDLDTGVQKAARRSIEQLRNSPR
jgi:eukaryotic-like serine/threonine-protein kinase